MPVVLFRKNKLRLTGFTGLPPLRFRTHSPTGVPVELCGALDATEIYRIVEDIRSMGKAIVVSSGEQPIAADPTDNIFVNLALDGKADLIISGDSHLLQLNKFKNIRIVSVAEFMVQG